MTASDYKVGDGIVYKFSDPKVNAGKEQVSTGKVVDHFGDGLVIDLIKPITWFDNAAENRNSGVYNHQSYTSKQSSSSFELYDGEENPYGSLKNLSKKTIQENTKIIEKVIKSLRAKGLLNEADKAVPRITRRFSVDYGRTREKELENLSYQIESAITDNDEVNLRNGFGDEVDKVLAAADKAVPGIARRFSADYGRTRSRAAVVRIMQLKKYGLKDFSSYDSSSTLKQLGSEDEVIKKALEYIGYKDWITLYKFV